ncbi:DUF6479 family protein [Streptomyces sp. NPDC050560]|uniref:DUF6479 family protein n=1 Tax=Streptomyces sp. NPDC050560 TaxID=3365630 RepID=UPI0037BAF22B
MSMSEQSTQTVLAFSDVLVGVGAFVGALIIAGVLLWAFLWGQRSMERERPRPRADEQPHLPDGGPVEEESERREPEELSPREDRDRLTPHTIPGFGNSGSRRSDSQRPRKWSPGSSGSFGSGGPGGRR